MVGIKISWREYRAKEIFIEKYMSDFFVVGIKRTIIGLIFYFWNLRPAIITNLMGEGFILLTRGYRFMGGVPPPFDTLKIGTSTDDIKLKLYR